MAKVFINNVDKFGIISDMPAHRLPVEAWSAGQNVRFHDGVVSRSRGVSAVLGTPSITPYYMQYWNTAAAQYWFYANASAIYRTDGTTHTDVTNTGGPYSGNAWPRWNGGTLNGIPILNHDAWTDPPQSWDGSANFEDLPNWPAGWYAKVVRPFKNWLIALDMVRGGTAYPWEVRWSASAPPGAVPSTWTAAPGNDAGTTNALAETTDFIVDCLQLGNSNMIYKDNSVWAQEWIGGNQVFSHRKRFGEFGLLAIGCVGQVFNQHLVVTQDDVVLHNGTEAQSIIDERNRRFLFNTLDRDFASRCCVVVAQRQSEVLIALPESGSNGYLTLLAVWNWKTNTWSFRELIAGGTLASGVVPAVAGFTFDGSAGVTFDDDSGVFDERPSSVGRDIVVSRVDSTLQFGKLYDGYQNLGNNYTSYVERIGLPIAGVARDGSPVIDPESVKQVNGVIPLITADPGVTVDVRVGVQQKIDGSVSWGAPTAFNPATDTKVDCTMAGKLIAVRFESASGGQWKLNGYGLDVQVIARF